VVLTVSTLLAELDQVTAVVRLAVEPSLYVPVAVSCWVDPAASDSGVGVTAIELKVAALTATGTVVLKLPEVTVIVAAPWATVVISPPLETVATLGAELA
jgi:hypothetical protein